MVRLGAIMTQQHGLYYEKKWDSYKINSKQ